MASGFFNMKAISDKPLIPADFLIDEHQNISKAYYGKDFGDHLPIEEILNAGEVVAKKPTNRHL